MTPQHALLLIFLAAVAPAAVAPGEGCTTGCALALASYNVQVTQNLTNIAALFGIEDYHKLAPYNTDKPYVLPAGESVRVPFPCRCLALPAVPSSTYLAGVFPYVSPASTSERVGGGFINYPLYPGNPAPTGDTYATIAAIYDNLTTATWLQATNSYAGNQVSPMSTVNVTINCSCGDPKVSPYGLFLTVALRDGETLSSVAASYGFSTPSDMDMLRAINPGMDGVKGRGLVYIPVKDGSGSALPPGSSAYKSNNTVTIDGLGNAPPPGSQAYKKVIRGVVVGTSGLFGVCIMLVTSLLCYRRYYGTMLPWQKGSTNAQRIESFLQKQGTSHPKRYTYSEVRRMTKSFTHKLGQGGYGAVYRGNLPDGCEIAVKMLKDTEGDGEEFMNEVASISRTSHVNVVTLLGFSLQGSKRGLVYEYMPNGSLERYTFGSSSAEGENSLSWDRLLDILIGIARGLDYLHNGCHTRIVHFDIKPQNILLDQGYCPKISDFGLAKLCRQKESKVSLIGARGTIGYIAPEVFLRNYGAVSSKSDVYSYGMVILEMVGARKQIDVNTNNSSMYFPQWLYENLDQFCSGTSTSEIISSNTTELVRKMTLVGLWCIQFSPADRPSMSRVLEMLESKVMDLQLPPKAF